MVEIIFEVTNEHMKDDVMDAFNEKVVPFFGGDKNLGIGELI
ncbi:MAG: hypothetical protein AAB787_03015 [Patescibacteria group bacterium]